MIMNVISWPTSVVVELNAIAKIHKYKRFCEEHHFISMAMEVHNTSEHDVDRFIKECVHLFHDKQSKGHLSSFFAFSR
jgi:antirestriction protein